MNNSNNDIMSITSDSENDFSIDKYLSPVPQTYILTPDDDLLKICPFLEGKDFFVPNSDKKDTYETERDQLTTAISSCPKNKLQKYSAPPVTDLPWPDKQKSRQHFDKDLSDLQAKLASHTRLIDNATMELLRDNELSAEATEKYLEIFSNLRTHTKFLSHSVHDARVQNLEHAHGMQIIGKKSTQEPIVDSAKLTECRKLLLSIKRNVYSNGHSKYKNFSTTHNSGTNYKTQPSTNQNNDNSQYFHHAQSSPNRGRGRGRGRGQTNPQ